VPIRQTELTSKFAWAGSATSQILDMAYIE